MFEIIQKKVLDHSTLNHQLGLWRFMDKKIVFTNGCFDILHLGHIDYLCKAAELGDVLIIGINSDQSVSNIKGPNRPINDEKQRSLVMASLHFVDRVIIFEEATPYELIKTVQPDVLVKGADYKPEDIVGADIVKAKGGKIMTLDYLPGYSTTLIEQKIRNVQKNS
ncbi:MAG: D-glycero-beta-D-manno-heptose 1-phosphate adenylyltransferase [Bacteroidetes bacterium]|nr:MAG: D-glycero-beta-D-manno-heptose 1-phosphate adenylyltransferase [Bacteroidota bacterium]